MAVAPIQRRQFIAALGPDRSRELVIQSHQDEADQVRIMVKDCGVGIDAENADRLFNAFFTTKSSGMGIDLPLDHRSSRRTTMGHAKFASRGDISLHPAFAQE